MANPSADAILSIPLTWNGVLKTRLVPLEGDVELMSAELRTISIPTRKVPENLLTARRKRHRSAYVCIVCSLPMPQPKFMCHVIEGGSSALHVEDEDRYRPDGGDMCFLPLGSDCLRLHPELKPYAHKVQPGTIG